jgi:hypothetical protein
MIRYKSNVTRPGSIPDIEHPLDHFNFFPFCDLNAMNVLQVTSLISQIRLAL